MNTGTPAGPDGKFLTADDGLRIGCGSAAKDAGYAGTPATDILGNARQGLTDIGAYEYTGSTCPTLIYVDGSRPNNLGDGTSWATAKRDVQAGINTVGAGGDVWVKAGTYLPTQDPNGDAYTADARNKAFYLTTKDVRLYGGFAGNETLLSQRNVATNVTILSGDLDGSAGTNDAYHVLVTRNRSNACVVDGFTITGGRATGSGTFAGIATYPQYSGGGLYNTDAGVPQITGCTFLANSASTEGGGIYNTTSSNATLSNCTFLNNTATSGGGMFNTNSSNPQLSSCTFSGNTATSYGGGMHNTNSGGAQLSNCTFSANTASVGGGMYNTNGSYVALAGCTLSANTASSSGGGMYNSYGGIGTLTNCIFSANTASAGGGMYNIYGASPVMNSCVFLGECGNQQWRRHVSGSGQRSADQQLYLQRQYYRQQWRRPVYDCQRRR